MAFKNLRHSLLALCIAGVAGIAQAAAINTTTYASLGGAHQIGFGGIDCPNSNLAPDENGCVLNGLQRFGAATFGEHFQGQTVSVDGSQRDALSGLPGGPLKLRAGPDNANLVLAEVGGTVGLGGMGPAGVSDEGVPLSEASGEGAISILFDGDQSKFGFRVHQGSSTGRLFLAFFRFDGSLIESLILTGLRNDNNPNLPVEFAFSREGGKQDIAGVSLWNEDGGGLFLDGLLHDIDTRRQPPGNVPEPGALLLAGVALMVASRRVRK